MKITNEECLEQINTLISNCEFGEKLFNTYTTKLYTLAEIHERIAFVNTLLSHNTSVYYQLWMVSLTYLLGDHMKVKNMFLAIAPDSYSKQLGFFYQYILGFDPLFDSFILHETDHFIFHLHPKRAADPKIQHQIERRELGAKNHCEFLKTTPDRKIHYYLWDTADMNRSGIYRSEAFSAYFTIHEDYAFDWHESMHVYNVHYGIESPCSFIFEGIAVCRDGRMGAYRLKFAQDAYKKFNIQPNIKLWWTDRDSFRNENSAITYTAAGLLCYNLVKLDKTKFRQLLRYQKLEDAYRIYGKETIENVIAETERSIVAWKTN